MPFGYVDTQHINFPEGQDEARLRGLQNRLGINYLEFIRRVDAAMAALNTRDTLMSLLVSDTTELSITQGGSSDKVWQRSAEYTPGRPQRTGPGRAWMLPLYFYEIDLGFTSRALMTMRTENFDDELRTTVQAVDRGRRADVLMRLFDDGELPLDDDGTGATPGFAGSGTGTNAFVGRLSNGGATAGSYTHYFQAAATGPAVDTAIKAMQTNMELWDSGPFDLIASQNVINLITGNQADDTQFVSAGSTLLRPGEAQTEALVDAATYLGVYNGRIRVRYPEYQVAGDAFALVRSYGAGNPNNPLKWRYDPLFGSTAYVDDQTLTPLSEAMILQTYGIGVGNRTGAALCSVGGTAGVYAAPAISR